MPRLNRYLTIFAFTACAMASAPVHACQLVCMQTNITYNGNLGGLAGADAKCAAEFPGFKFARSATILANLPQASASGRVYTAVGSPNNGPGGGIYEVSVPYNAPGGTAVYGVAAAPASSSIFDDAWVHSASNCAAWTSSSSSGSIVGTPSTSCITLHPLLCCNM